VVEVQTLADTINILEDGELIAAHPVLAGRGQRRIAAGHRTAPLPVTSATPPEPSTPPVPPGSVVTPRPLAFYEAVGRRLAADGGAS
jgi:hypothetical protein